MVVLGSIFGLPLPYTRFPHNSRCPYPIGRYNECLGYLAGNIQGRCKKKETQLCIAVQNRISPNIELPIKQHYLNLNVRSAIRYLHHTTKIQIKSERQAILQRNLSHFKALQSFFS